MMLKKNHFLLISLLLCAAISGCRENSAMSTPDNDEYLAELSQFLSGKNPESARSLKKFTETKQYAVFAKEMQEHWKAYESAYNIRIREWAKKNLSDVKNDFCLYPFAGGDFINAYNIYPNAKTYLLIGLETAGTVPDIAALSETENGKGLKMLSQGYDTFVKWNFYRTYGMEVDMEKSPYKGTIPHILAQMGWLDLKPVAAYKVSLNGKGSLEFVKLQKGEVITKGAIDFVTADGERKRVIFLNLDLENPALEKENSWKNYLAGLKNVCGVFKAASYLPPRENFSWIRDICLKNMDVIVQDDSAIPYKYFGKEWNVKLFGKYTTSNKIFPSYAQNDMKLAYAMTNPENIDFRFCYDMPDGGSNILIAKKK